MNDVKRRKAAMRKQLCANSKIIIDAHTHVGADPSLYQTVSVPYAMQSEDLIIRMDLNRIDAALCFPFVYTEYFSLPDMINHVFRRNSKSKSTCPYELENELLCRELYELLPENGKRLLPFAFFDPGRLQKQQAETLEKLFARFPVYGLKTATSYLQSHITDLLKRGKPILDFASRHNVPVTIHSAVIDGDPWADVFSILDVVRQRPDVRFAVAHTCRFDRRALEQAATLDNCFVDFSAFYIHCLLARENGPGIAAKKYRFPADYRDPAAVMQRIAETYPNKMLWGTDTPANRWAAPFVDDKGNVTLFALPCEHLMESAILRKLPAGLRRKIAHDNTIQHLFGVEN